jgi:hypothetical protein
VEDLRHGRLDCRARFGAARDLVLLMRSAHESVNAGMGAVRDLGRIAAAARLGRDHPLHVPSGGDVDSGFNAFIYRP